MYMGFERQMLPRKAPCRWMSSDERYAVLHMDRQSCRNRESGLMFWMSLIVVANWKWCNGDISWYPNVSRMLEKMSVDLRRLMDLHFLAKISRNSPTNRSSVLPF